MAEAVGFVLGILPLVVSAVEHYDDIMGPVRRFRKFSSKVQRLCDELEIERTIFFTECLLLLTAITTRDTATAMLDDSNHPLWEDNELRASLSSQLGSLGPTCESIKTKIGQKLGEIRKMCDELNAVVSMPKDHEVIGDRSWRRRIGRKLKFSISEVGHQRTMADLRKLNQSF